MIVIAQLRIYFSDINSHLFNKGCNDSPLCLCGNICEDTTHFLMICQLYDAIGTTLISRLQQLNLHVPINHKLLLYGNTRLTLDLLITFKIESKRFLHNHKRRNGILKCIPSTLVLLLLIVCPSIIPHNLTNYLPISMTVSSHILFVILLSHMMYYFTMSNTIITVILFNKSRKPCIRFK